MATFTPIASKGVAGLRPTSAFLGLVKNSGMLGFIAAATLFCVADRSGAEEQIPQPSSRNSGDAESSVAREVELLKQRIEELEAAKLTHEDATRTLNQRIEELEAAKLAHEKATSRLNRRLDELETARVADKDATDEYATLTSDQRIGELEAAKVAEKGATDEDVRTLDQRVEELEKAKIAHEDATRSIIRQSFAERGSSINDYVDFSGTLEALAFRAEDFAGVRESDVLFDTADLDFKIRVSDWVSGSLVLSYEPGTDVLFPTTTGDEAFVDRINVREGFITLGNTERFPLFGMVGRAVVPFGISTGDPVTSALTLIDPLTIEVFETREDFIMFGFEGPTPPPPPPLAATPVPRPPPVRPLLVNPLVRKLSTWLCSSLSCYPPPPKPVPPAVPPTSLPPFNAAVYFYNGDTADGGGDHIEHLGGTLGYRTKGMFSPGRIPWAIDFDVDFNSSVFDSDFLAFEYGPFLNQIGFVPGMAAHLKSNLGPAGLIFEWNGAIDDATFTDDLGQAFSISPGSWQIQFAYQFDFNPSVVEIGAQGTYFVVGYSESEDLAGARRLIGDPLMPTRVGFVPEKRLNVGVGEWVLESLRVAVEYSHAWDYSIAEGGTGNSADGIFGQLTYEW
ncbi:MAG: hypothetical protein ACT4NU_02590 [Chromatiales bacterium]